MNGIASDCMCDGILNSQFIIHNSEGLSHSVRTLRPPADGGAVDENVIDAETDGDHQAITLLEELTEATRALPSVRSTGSPWVIPVKRTPERDPP